MIGKIISDHSGLTKLLGGEVAQVYEPIIRLHVRDDEWKALKKEIDAANGDTVKIKLAIDKAGLSNVDELYDYVMNQVKNGEAIDNGSVNNLIQTQNFKNIASQASGFKGVNTAIKEYNALTDTASKSKLAETISTTNTSLGKYLTGLNGAEAGLGNYAGSLVTATAKTIILETATMAMNAAISMVASVVATKVVSYLISVIDNTIHSAEKIREAAEEAKSAISDIKSEFDNLKSTTDDVKDRFAELAQNVENLGKINQSRGELSTDDYNEFLDLSNQLAELFPQLTKGYDDNGNAILSLSGNVDTITSSLNNLISVQQKLANQEILDEMPDVWNEYTVNLGEYEDELNDAEKKVKSYQAALSKIFTNDSDKLTITNEQANSAIISALKKIGVNAYTNDALYSVHKSYSGRDRGLGGTFKSADWDLTQLTDAQLEQLKNELGSLGSEYEDAVQLTKGKIETANSEMSSYINTWLSTGSAQWSFDHMSSDMQNVVKDILMDSNWVSSLPTDIKTSGWNKVSDWLEKNFLFTINKIDDNKIQAALADAVNNDLSLNSLQDIITKILAIDGFDEKNPLIVYLQTKLTDSKDLSTDVKNILQDEFDDKVGELSLEDLKIAANLEIPEDTLLTWDELKTKIKEHKENIQGINAASQVFSSTAEKLSNLFNLGTDSSPFDGLIDNTEKFTKALSSCESKITSVADAINEYKKNGNLSVETALKLIESNEAYGNALEFTADGIKLNEDALKDELKAQLEILKVQLEEQSNLDNLIASKNDEALSRYSNSLAMLSEYESGNMRTVPAAMTEALGYDIQEDSIANIKNEAANTDPKIQEEYNNLVKVSEESAKRAEYIQSMIDSISNGKFLSSSNSSSSSSKTLKTNTTYYNPYDDWLEAKKYALEKFTKENDRLDLLFDKAVETDNEAAMKNVNEKLSVNSDKYKEAVNSALSDVDKQINSIMSELSKTNSAFTGKSIDEILGDPTLLTKVSKAYDDAIINAQNSDNDALESQLSQAQSKVDSLTNSLSSLVDYKEELQENLFDIDTSKLERAKEISDSFESKVQFKIEVLTDVKGTEDEQIDYYQSLQENAHNMAEEYRAAGYEDGSSEIQGYQEAWREYAEKIRDLKDQKLNNSVEDIDNQISDIDFQIEINGDKDFKANIELIGQQIDLTKDKIWAYEQEIERLDEAYADNQNDEYYVERVRELRENIQDANLTMNDYYKQMQDTAKAELDTLKSVEDEIIEMLKDKYDTISDAYSDRIELEKEYIDKRKEALNDLLDYYEKKWDLEDREADRQDKLADRNNLVQDRAKLEAAAATGDLSAIAEINDLNDSIADTDKDIAADSKEAWRDDVRNRIDEDLDALDDLSAKYDEDLEKFNEVINEKLKNENLYAEARKVIETGVFEDAYGKELSLAEAHKAWTDEFGEGLSIVGEQLETEFLEKLTQIHDICEDLPKLLSQASDLGVRDFLEGQGYTVGWDQDTKEMLVNGQRFSDKLFSRDEDGRLIATANQIAELMSAVGLASSNIKSTEAINTSSENALKYNNIPKTDTESLLSSKQDKLISIDEFIAMYKDKNFNDFIQPINSINDYAAKISNQISELNSAVIPNIIPQTVSVDNSITIQGNADSVTFAQMQNAMAQQAKNMPEIVAKAFNSSLKAKGVIGRV